MGARWPARLATGWLAGVLLTLCGGAAAQGPAPLRPEIVEAYVDGVMRQAMETSATPGASVTVVQDGRVLLAKGYGLARVTPQPRAADADTLFQVASISKTPVYLLTMGLVQRGRLRLEDPINGHLPERLRVADAGFPAITIRHLLTHSAGFEDSALGHLFVNAPERLVPLESYLTRYRVKPVRAPGVQISYSNYALGLLGVIVARAHGADWPTVAERQLLRPLGMTRSTYREPITPRAGLPAAMSPTVAANITQQLAGGPGAWRVRETEYNPNPPAGGLHASANDMARYLLALTDPARLEAAGVINRPTFAQMLKPAMPLPGASRHGFINYPMPGDREGFGHGGAMAFGASDLVIVPELRLGIFVSTNGRGGFTFVNEFARRMIAQFYPGAERPVVRDAAVLDAARQAAGSWISNRRAMARSERFLMLFTASVGVQVRDDGDLVFTPFAGRAQLFQPIGAGAWRSAARLTTLRLAADAQGRPTLWPSSGATSYQRASLLDRPPVVLGVLALGLITALWVAIGCLRRVRRLDRIGWSRLAAGLTWTIGLGGLLIFIARNADEDVSSGLLFSYPAPFALWCWLLLAAAALTLVALVLSARARAGWRAIAPLLVLLAVAAVCWRLGILGFTGF